jgi:hypothetical protein
MHLRWASLMVPCPLRFAGRARYFWRIVKLLGRRDQRNSDGIMQARLRGIERLPIRLALFYVVSTFLIFAFGPFDWPVDNWATLISFLALSLVCLWAGFRWSIARPPSEPVAINSRWIITLGSAAAVAILFVAAPVYTGRGPLQVLEALSDQGGAYSLLQDQLELTAGSRGPIALARIVTWPCVIGAIPLGILQWTQLRARFRCLIAVIFASIVISSLLRGTDRESADLLAVVFSSVGVLAARSLVHGHLKIRKLRHRARYAIVIVLILLIATASLFVQRKQERFANIDALCFAQTDGDPGICADFNYEPFAFFDIDDRDRFNASMAAAYFSQGYYGLSLALDLGAFRTTWGIGHAPFIATLYTNITGDAELYTRSYTYRLRDLGWSDENQWSTMFPWIANDISFFGVPLLMLLIGAAFGASWRDAVFANDDRAAVVFAIFGIMLGYLPANSQVTLVPDHYFALLVWLSLWLLARRQPSKRVTAMQLQR